MSPRSSNEIRNLRSDNVIPDHDGCEMREVDVDATSKAEEEQKEAKVGEDGDVEHDKLDTQKDKGSQNSEAAAAKTSGANNEGDRLANASKEGEAREQTGPSSSVTALALSNVTHNRENSNQPAASVARRTRPPPHEAYPNVTANGFAQQQVRPPPRGQVLFGFSGNGNGIPNRQQNVNGAAYHQQNLDYHRWNANGQGNQFLPADYYLGQPQQRVVQGHNQLQLANYYPAQHQQQAYVPHPPVVHGQGLDGVTYGPMLHQEVYDRSIYRGGIQSQRSVSEWLYDPIIYNQALGPVYQALGPVFQAPPPIQPNTRSRLFGFQAPGPVLQALPRAVNGAPWQSRPAPAAARPAPFQAPALGSRALVPPARQVGVRPRVESVAPVPDPRQAPVDTLAPSFPARSTESSQAVFVQGSSLGPVASSSRLPTAEQQSGTKRGRSDSTPSDSILFSCKWRTHNRPGVCEKYSVSKNRLLDHIRFDHNELVRGRVKFNCRWQACGNNSDGGFEGWWRLKRHIETVHLRAFQSKSPVEPKAKKQKR